MSHENQAFMECDQEKTHQVDVSSGKLSCQQRSMHCEFHVFILDFMKQEINEVSQSLTKGKSLGVDSIQKSDQIINITPLSALPML